MGATRTENTALGRRATPLIKQVQRLIRHVELHPPAGVNAHGHGGKNHLSVHGYVGKHLWEYAESKRHPADKRMWAKIDGAVHFLYRTCIDKRSFGRMAAWDLIEEWLPVFKKHLQDLQAVAAVPEDVEVDRVVIAPPVTAEGMPIVTQAEYDSLIERLRDAEASSVKGYNPPNEFDAAKMMTDILVDFPWSTCRRITEYVETWLNARPDSPLNPRLAEGAIRGDN